MASGVNVKMGISGVAQFKQGMKESQAAVKNLDQQLKLNEQQLKLNGDAETYLQNNVKELMDSYYGVCLNDYVEVFRPMCDVFFTEYGKTLDLLTIS